MVRHDIMKQDLSHETRHDIIKHFILLCNHITQSCISSQKITLGRQSFVFILPPQFHHCQSVKVVKGKYYKLIQDYL